MGILNGEGPKIEKLRKCKKKKKKIFTANSIRNATLFAVYKFSFVQMKEFELDGPVAPPQRDL